MFQNSSVGITFLRQTKFPVSLAVCPLKKTGTKTTQKESTKAHSLPFQHHVSGFIVLLSNFGFCNQEPGVVFFSPMTNHAIFQTLPLLQRSLKAIAWCWKHRDHKGSNVESPRVPRVSFIPRSLQKDPRVTDP